MWKGEHCGQDVAVKVIRMPSCAELQSLQRVGGICCAILPCVYALTEPLQRFCKEVVMWKSLRHPNVLPLIGVTMTEIHFSMVSEWMINGNIKEFTKAHPDEDRLELVGFSFKILSSSLQVH